MNWVLLPTGTRKNERDVPNHPYRADSRISAMYLDSLTIRQWIRDWFGFEILNGGDLMKLAIGIFVLALMALPGVAKAQDNNMSDSSQKATGCLAKGTAANAYTLTDDSGKVWVLHSKTVQLGEHVGHTVTVTGTPVTPKSKGNGDNSSGDASQSNHLRVTDLKMVSDSCQK
jgi:hypothetical protein